MKREVTRVRRTFALTSPKSVWSYKDRLLEYHTNGSQRQRVKGGNVVGRVHLATGIKYKEIVAAFRQTHERRYVLIILVKKKEDEGLINRLKT